MENDIDDEDSDIRFCSEGLKLDGIVAYIMSESEFRESFPDSTECDDIEEFDYCFDDDDLDTIYVSEFLERISSFLDDKFVSESTEIINSYEKDDVMNLIDLENASKKNNLQT